MLNNYQKKILFESKNMFKNSTLEEWVSELFDSLDSALGRELNRDIDSDNYILLKNGVVAPLLEQQQKFITFVEKMLDFTDIEKFDGYASSSYSGIRQALLNLDLFVDVKILLLGSAARQIVVIAKDGVDLEKEKVKICQTIFKYDGLLPTYNEAVLPDAIVVDITASTGQSIKIAFFKAKERTFDVSITYFLDSEEATLDYNIAETVKFAFISIYAQYYGFIGKNINIQDFLAITRDVSGIRKVSLSFQEIDSEGKPIGEPIVDTDIAIEDNTIFYYKNIEVVSGGNKALVHNLNSDVKHE